MESSRKRFEGKPVRFLKMNAEHLEFGDESFDTVCISHSLHHLGKIDRVLAEMNVFEVWRKFRASRVLLWWNQSAAQKADQLRHEWEARIDSLLGITHNKTLTKQRILDIAHSLDLRSWKSSNLHIPWTACSGKRKYECEDPKNQATFHTSIRNIDDTAKRIEDYSDLEIRNRLKEEGETIKKTIEKSGSAPPSYLLIIGRK